MSSPAQAAAARANGAKSNGPVTPQGRARSSQNALRHGLSAQAVVLHGEEAADFGHLRLSYLHRFQPADQAELDLVETLAVSQWRLRRIPMLEVEVFENLHYRHQTRIEDQLDDHAPFNKRMGWVFLEAAKGKSLSLLLRYEGQLTRTYERSLKALQILQKARLAAAPAVERELQNEPKPAGGTAASVGNAPAPDVGRVANLPPMVNRSVSVSPDPAAAQDPPAAHVCPDPAARLGERFHQPLPACPPMSRSAIASGTALTDGVS